ncbi:HIR complex subunit [Malassezia cuniculi]|uniref:Protein HIR n=1 Tax=Malassezia cuniculi TaxID=948313 RepID=A0AAF0EVL1_9BASI|nr:HIR complex subunit [Malassezia cuniculi]
MTVKITVPDWVSHRSEDKGKRATIYSVAIHPDGSRLATGSLDTKIRIWATSPIQNAESTEPQLLSTLARHTGAVLALRWSHSGRFLASGSDDTIALVWELDMAGGGSSAFGTTETCIESWRPYRRLPGHESDVTDLAWSEHDEYLATVGLDSLVIIWSGQSFDRIRTIRGHEGFVKGVSFDPVDQYIATASDDRTVKIWRIEDWGLEASVTDPFKTSPSSTFFRRLAWAPDGSRLLTANAMSGPVFVSSIIQRDDWSSEMSLVGHENTVTVVAFSPRFFCEPGTDNPVTVVALGSQDQSVSVWLSRLERPVLVARGLFERHIMDLSWSSDGYTLYACSSDGSVAALVFSEDELGATLPDDRLQEARASHGFVRSTQPVHSVHASLPRVGTAEQPRILTVHKGPSAPKGRLQQHITINRDGKRRIRPTLLSEDGQEAIATPPTDPLATLLRPSEGRTLGSSAPPVQNRPAVVIAAAETSSAQAFVPPPTLSHVEITANRLCVQAQNYTDRPNEITAQIDGQVEWIDFPTHPVLLLAADELVVAALADCSLLWYSRQGRMITGLQLGAPCAALATRGKTIAALTCLGELHCWDDGSHIVAHISLQNASCVHAFYIHTNGVPVAVLNSTKEAYALDKRRGAVAIVSSARFQSSASWDARMQTSADPVRAVEGHINSLQTTLPSSPHPDFVLATTIRHLETRLEAARLLDSASEYRQALHALARKLADEGIVNQAEDLVRTLLGPIFYKPGISDTWTPNILGMEKRELLSSVLQVMGASRALAGLVQKYQELLQTMQA